LFTEKNALVQRGIDDDRMDISHIDCNAQRAKSARDLLPL
jgi:hypothetical protein